MLARTPGLPLPDTERHSEHAEPCPIIDTRTTALLLVPSVREGSVTPFTSTDTKIAHVRDHEHTQHAKCHGPELDAASQRPVAGVGSIILLGLPGTRVCRVTQGQFVSRLLLASTTDLAGGDMLSRARKSRQSVDERCAVTLDSSSTMACVPKSPTIE